MSQAYSNENCVVHHWPRTSPGGFSRSIGLVEFQQCNNCLSVKITFESEVLVDNRWVTVTDERIVEPDLRIATQKAASNEEHD